MSGHIYSALYSKLANVQKAEKDTTLLPAPLLSFLKSNNVDRSQDSSNESSTSAEVEAQGRLTNWFHQADTDPLMFKGMSRHQRLMGFFLCLLAASFCLCLAMLFLPVIATPFGMRKYVLLHTLGSVLLIGSFSFLWGPWNHIKSLFSIERLPFTLSYFVSLLGGLYAVIVWQSAVFSALALISQICLVVWQIVVSVPGGRTGLSALLRTSLWTVKGISKGLPV
ncbi:Protein transport protein [Schistosoma japonicum]|uniref:Vesicle transport protein n=1 Tax=Schistosoma japonicum TaxID=6182 RepID=A0A4Z2DB38_SCHJA|nr:Protein transport protein [Schistosoma japonicum]